MFPQKGQYIEFVQDLNFETGEVTINKFNMLTEKVIKGQAKVNHSIFQGMILLAEKEEEDETIVLYNRPKNVNWKSVKVSKEE